MEYKAVIDAGYNSFRLSLYRVFPNGAFSLTASLREYVRLGMGVSEGLPIPEEGITRAEEALRKFRDFLDRKGVSNVVVLGTSAFRYARNGQEVAERLSRAVGHAIRVVSSEEEGRLSALGVLNSLPVGEGVAFDLGGGSLEVVYFSKRRITQIHYFPLGALRLADRPAEEIRKTVREYLSSLPPSQGVLVGSGGNLRAIAKMDLKLEGEKLDVIHGHTISYERIARYSKTLPSMSAEERSRLPGISEERAITVHSAVLVIRELMDILGKGEVMVSSFGLREGAMMRGEMTSVGEMREFWLEGLAYHFGLDPFLDAYREVKGSSGEVLATAFYLLQLMKASGFLDPYIACYRAFRNMVLPGFTAEEVNLITTLCAVAKKYKKKYYSNVKKVMDKESLLAKAKELRTINESYEFGVRK